VVGLAVVLTLGLLPGWVLIAALTYQLIALRVLWALVTTPRERPWRAVGAVVVGLALAPLLAAVQLLPAAELARESYRVAAEALEFANFGPSETTLLNRIRLRMPPVPFTVAVFVLAAAAPFVSSQRGRVTFYMLTGILYTVLALGTATPLYGLYVKIPPGASTLKYPWRLWWITGFCLAMLTAFCLDGLTERGRQRSTRWLAVAAATLIAGGLLGFTPGGLRGVEIVALAGAVAALVVVAVRPVLGRAAAWLALGVLVLNLIAVPVRHGGYLLPSASALWHYRETFAELDPPITAQDRVFSIPGVSTLFGLTFRRKTATVLRVPDLNDYDALLGQRFSDYLATLWPRAAPITTMDDFLRALEPSRFQRRLLDLASIRYVITSPPVDIAEHGLDLPVVPPTGSGLRFYRNDAALPRVRYKDRRATAARLSTIISGELQDKPLESALRQVLGEDPNNPQANLRLGYVLVESNRCAEAVPFLKAAIAAKMPTADAHLGLAQCQVAARRFDDAAKTLGEAEHAEPGNPVVLANLGIVLSDAGRDRDAIAPLQRALTLYPDFHQARFNLARVFARAGQRADAAREAQDLLTRLPANAPQRAEVQRLLDAVR
jgi:tetratricopeptide (TPR) repeat protein